MNVKPIVNYQQWRRCIEVDCGIPLVPDYISTRLTALTQPGEEPRRFAQLYGEAHLQRVVGWFQRASNELTQSPP